MIRIFYSLVFVIISNAALAQSTITLDEFNPNSDSKDTATNSKSLSDVQTEMKSCLLDKTHCKNAEFGNAASFSLEDVVNLGVIDRSKVASNAADSTDGTNTKNDPLPSIDIEVLFDYNSSVVRSDQLPKLVDLAGLLRASDFSQFGYAFFGHTDAKGSQKFNQALSRRRAKAVSQMVASISKLPTERFATKGLGFSRLKNPSDPFGASNRRVQLVLVPLK